MPRDLFSGVLLFSDLASLKSMTLPRLGDIDDSDVIMRGCVMNQDEHHIVSIAFGIVVFITRVTILR